jgi:HK97 family phage prohead protease
MTVLTRALFECRTHTAPIEFRSSGDGKITATGYAAVFNKLSQNLGGYVEQMAPGAFTQTITQQDVRALYNHEPSLLLGRMSSGTLRLSEDGTGLGYEIDLPDTTVGRDVATMLERRDLTGSSIGFRIVDAEPGETDQGFPLVTIKAASLRDVGPVTFPAYEDTEASLRCLAEWKHLDLDEVREASARNELRSLLHREVEETESPETEASDLDGRETPTVKRLLRSFGAY